VTEQVDKNATGCWNDKFFVLHTELNRDELEHFFLERYQPTPLTSPWNGGSGYYEKDNKAAIQSILESDSSRFAAYRQTIKLVKAILKGSNTKQKPEREQKTELFKRLRARLDDHSLKWLDATVALGETDSKGNTSATYAPILGTGGNDGRLEFSNNFMQRLVELFLSPKAKPKQNLELLGSALFGEVGRFLGKSPIGQFDPGSAGGVNLTVGLEGNAAVNPWYYILMIEGSLTLATAAVGRFRGSFQNGGRTGSSFPFTVSHLGSGNGKLAPEEANRHELWVPLWKRPASFAEVQYLFAEGRAQNGKMQAKNPIEFSLALASFGTSRGISGFTRYAFLQRNGKSYFATPLGYHPTGSRDGASLIREVERWFASFRGVLAAHAAGARSLVNRYDSAVMEYLKTGQQLGFTRVMENLGLLHQYISRNEKLREKIRPFPQLSPEWANEANDGSIEFRLAHSLGSLGDSAADPTSTIRAQLSPYNPNSQKWDEVGYIPRWVGRDLTERMANLLEHRLRVAHGSPKLLRGGPASPIRGSVGASPHDIAEFIAENLNESRMERLLFGLALVKPPRNRPRDENWGTGFLIPQYIIPKLALHQGPSLPQSADDDVANRSQVMRVFEQNIDYRTPPPAIPRMLYSGKVKSALREARRFLLSRPLVLPEDLTNLKLLGHLQARRLAAALLFPISTSTYFHLAKHLIDINRTQYDSIEESEQSYV